MAAGDATVTALSNILKTRYDQKVFHQMFYRKAPFAGTVRKDDKFGGNNARITLRYGAPQGGSGDFATAQANKTSSSDVGFLLARAKDYQVSGISGEALAAAEGDENTLYNGLKGEMEGSMRNLNRSIQITLHRNGGGQRGRGDGAYAVGGAVIQLGNGGVAGTGSIADITNFEVGMKLQFSADDGYNNGGALAGVRAGTVAVQSVNRVLGTITCTGNVNAGIGAAVNSDWIFRQGDYSVMAKGTAGWIPDTAPTAGDSWFGVDRSVDTTRLAGVIYSGNGGNKIETLIDAAELAGREGADDLTCYINNLDRADIVKSLDGKAVYEPVKSTDGTFGYRALMIEGPDSAIKVISDINMPRGKFKLLQMDTWVLKSVKGVPRLLDFDGNKMLRESSSDGYEWRMGGYFQTGNEAPGYNTAGTF